MGRKKKIIEEEVLPLIEEPEMVIVPLPTRKGVEKLSVDFPNEGLNNMAMKINEIIDNIS